MTSSSADSGLRPFRLDVPRSDLDDLHDRLDRTRWPQGLPATGWSYGVPTDCLRELARYRRQEYDWRAAEALLNEWPQFTTVIRPSAPRTWCAGRSSTGAATSRRWRNPTRWWAT